MEVEAAGVTIDTPSTAREWSVTPRKSVLTWYISSYVTQLVGTLLVSKGEGAHNYVSATPQS